MSEGPFPASRCDHICLMAKSGWSFEDPMIEPPFVAIYGAQMGPNADNLRGPASARAYCEPSYSYAPHAHLSGFEPGLLDFHCMGWTQDGLEMGNGRQQVFMVGWVTNAQGEYM